MSPGGSSTGFFVSSFLQGNASRYYRANQLGIYLQDKFQVTPNLSLTAGIRYDWDGGLTEKEGRIFNFDPSLYTYNAAEDVISNPGFIIAGQQQKWNARSISRHHTHRPPVGHRTAARYCLAA